MRSKFSAVSGFLSTVKNIMKFAGKAIKSVKTPRGGWPAVALLFWLTTINYVVMLRSCRAADRRLEARGESPNPREHVNNCP